MAFHLFTCMWLDIGVLKHHIYQANNEFDDVDRVDGASKCIPNYGIDSRRKKIVHFSFYDQF